MQTQTYDVGQEIDGLAQKYQDQLGLSYSDALKKVAREKPALWARYSRGERQPDPKDAEGADEFSRRIVAYSEHFAVDKTTAEKMVREHDPAMKKYSTQGGSITMSTENIPLDAGSVVDVRAQERMKQGAKNYSEAMQAVLADDPLLAECYRAGKPYLEASAHSYHSYQAEMPNVTAKSQLGVLISGARDSDNSIDIPLALRVANLTPDLVRGAASERLDEIANKLIDTLGLRGMKSERYPETLRQARRENPALVAASETGRMDEAALKEIFWPWFSRDRKD